MATEKDNYHHGDVPRALMEAALVRIKNDGVEKLSLRAIARDIGVSQTAPYRHFKDKTHLLVKLASAGFHELANQKVDAITGTAPLQDMIEIGIAYVHFAKANPEQYKLMFGSKIGNRCEYDDLMAASEAAFAVIVNHATLGVESGDLIDRDPMILAKSAWTTVHGLASLAIDGFFNNLPMEFEVFLREQITFCIRGIARDTTKLDV